MKAILCALEKAQKLFTILTEWNIYVRYFNDTYELKGWEGFKRGRGRGEKCQMNIGIRAT